MCEVEFIYNGSKTMIQCKENESMQNICQKFTNKALVNKNDVFFSYSGQGGITFNEKLSFNQMASTMDKMEKKMTILVYNINADNEEDNDEFIIKSKNIVCPKCNNDIKMNIKNYKVNLFDCKNGHKRDNLSLKEFEKSQNIDLSKIKCGKCNQHKGKTFNHEFYKCLDCDINLCVLCRSRHDDDHNVIEYDKKYYICPGHNDFYTSYCNRCKENICIECENTHQNHDTTYFGTIMSNKRELQMKLKNLKEYIDKFNENYKEIIKVINEVKENLELYYKIKKDIIDNFDNRERNYELLINLKEISNNDYIIKDIEQVNNQKNILNKFNSILNIYNNMQSSKVNHKITLDEFHRKYSLLEEEKNEKENEIENLKQTISENENKMDKLSLIEKLVEEGMDEDDRTCTYSLENKCLLTELILSGNIFSEKVLNVMLEVDRGDFAPPESNPYANCPQYLGYNVTISAPHMHAYALEYLSDYCVEGANILDIGSGSGYLTVALSKMTNDTGTVVGVEHISELYDFGLKNVKKNHSQLIENENIIFVKGDGRKGFKEYGPYKAIHVGAASEQVPEALIEQLSCDGRIFIPVGKKGEEQYISIVDKDSNGEVTIKKLFKVCYGMLTDVATQLKGK
jgi:protein-L-isoaspartate(D-aspartate) O-methyltransferase